MKTAIKNTSKRLRNTIFNRELNMTLVWLGIFLLGMTVYSIIVLENRYSAMVEKNNISFMRERLLTAATNTNSPAPVDFRTGDTYFPEAKLMIPSQGKPLGLTYSYNSDDATLHISKESLGSSALFKAQTMDALYASVVELQACQRGVKLSYNNLSGIPGFRASLKETLVGAKGAPLYLYVENGCNESPFEELVNVASTIKPY